MTGLVLEGGGAKGAFHVGAIKALLEEGYDFDIVAGTSVGAMNGALVAQGDFDLALKWWKELDASILFDKNEDGDTVYGNISHFVKTAKSFVLNRGLDTSRIKQLLREVVDENKFRASNMDFGMVTFSLTQRRPFELYKDDIPKGKLVDYLMASGNMPVFKIEPVDGNIFIDGSFYDNCPVNLPIRRGCNNIIIIKTYPLRPIKSYPTDGVETLVIKPSNGLGGILDFKRLTLSQNLELGYCEAKRATNRLVGKNYYITSPSEEDLFNALISIPDEEISLFEGYFNVFGADRRRFLMECIVPETATMLGLTHGGYTDILIGLMEYAAKRRNVNRIKVYDIKNFAKEIYAAGNANPVWSCNNSFFAPSPFRIADNEQFLLMLCDVFIKRLSVI